MNKEDSGRMIIWRLRSFAVGVTRDDAVLVELHYGEANHPQALAVRLTDEQLRRLAQDLLAAFQKASTRRRRRKN